MSLDKATQKKILDLNRKHTIYSTWSEGELFCKIIDAMLEPFKELEMDKVLGVEARGFILGAPIAYLLGKGFVVMRKGGRMYNEYYGDDVYTTSAKDYSSKNKTLEIEKNGKAIQPGDKILLVDDWFETGNQGHGAIRLVEQAGGEVIGISIMINEMNEEVERSFSDLKLNYLVRKS